MRTQPRDPALLLRAMQALSTCPMGSIRTEQPVEDVRRAERPFPIPAVDESEGAVKKVLMLYVRRVELARCHTTLKRYIRLYAVI